MPATIFETDGSREGDGKADGPSSRILTYKVGGTDDQAEVEALILDTVPDKFDDLYFQTHRFKPVGGGWWDVQVQYGLVQPLNGGETVVTFDTTGATKHVRQSIRTVESYPKGDGDPYSDTYNSDDGGGPIGVNGDSVEGVDVPTPTAKITIRKKWKIIDLPSETYLEDCHDLTGKVNDADVVIVYKGQVITAKAGELRFDGVQASDPEGDYWPMVYQFVRSKNVDKDSDPPVKLQFNITEGFDDPETGEPIPPGLYSVAIKKEGWDYVWVAYEEAASQDWPIKQAKFAKVERVMPRDDFSILALQ